MAVWTWRPGVLNDPPADVALIGDEPRIRQAVDRDRLKAHVEVLAAPDMEGRENRSAGSRRAREYIVTQLVGLGLRPFFGSYFHQEIRWGDRRWPHGLNIAGVLPAKEPSGDGECILVVAHYDHLGQGRKCTYAGADDNASGVASALEIARVLSGIDPDRRHDVVFVFPDTEEAPDVRKDTMGSVYLMDHLPVPTGKVRLSLALDVLANRSMGENLLVMGAETCPATANLLEKVRGEDDAVPTLASVPVLEQHPFLPSPKKRLHKGDYLGAMKHEVPFLFVLSGTAPTYHTPEDVPDSLDYGKLASVTKYAARLVYRAANETGAVTDFSGNAVDAKADVRSLTRVFKEVLNHPPAGLLPPMAARLAAHLVRIRQLGAILGQGTDLTDKQYQELRAAALDLQHALARPDKSKVGMLVQEVGRRLGRWLAQWL